MIHNVAVREIDHIHCQDAEEFVQLSQFLNIPSSVSPQIPPSPTASRRRERTLTKRGGVKLHKFARTVLVSGVKYGGYLYVSSLTYTKDHMQAEADRSVWSRGTMSSV
jgi:hypothetical protein